MRDGPGHRRPAHRNRPAAFLAGGQAGVARSAHARLPRGIAALRHRNFRLFWTGQLAAFRRPSFQRVYDLPERVVPPEILSEPTPGQEDAHRALLLVAARALGVATVGDLRDYYRPGVPKAPQRAGELVESADLIPVAVEGWTRPAFLARDARVPRRVDGLRTFVSPFDSLIWTRNRTERLFDFRYRIEIFTPAAKRIHGYYVLPFLMGDRFAARVDLKADRKTGRLLALATHGEPDINAKEIASELSDELRRLAEWLELESIEVELRGDLGRPLRAALSH